jgi:hypothetical protein
MQGFCFLAMMSFSIPALSVNFGFLYDSPVQYFNNVDWQMLDNAAEEALDHYPNGRIATWENPKTHNGGYVQPLTQTKQEGMPCRKLKIYIRAHERSDQYIFTFCKSKSDWKIRSDMM